MKDKLHIITGKPATGEVIHESILPKVIARLANTLTLNSKAHSGSIHHDIDQPLTEYERLELQTESSTPCQCQTIKDQAAQFDNTTMEPQHTV